MSDQKLTRTAERLISFAGRMCEYGRIIDSAAKMYRRKETSDSNKLKALEIQSTAVLRASQEASDKLLTIENAELLKALKNTQALLEAAQVGHSPYANDTPPPPRRGEQVN